MNLAFAANRFLLMPASSLTLSVSSSKNVSHPSGIEREATDFNRNRADGAGSLAQDRDCAVCGSSISQCCFLRPRAARGGAHWLHKGSLMTSTQYLLRSDKVRPTSGILNTGSALK